MEYSRDERQDAWDMLEPTDIVNYNLPPGWNQSLQRGFHSPAINNGIFTAESDFDPAGAAVSVDTNMLLAVKSGQKIDTNKYRYFCYRMQLDTTNINRSIDLQQLNDAGFVSRFIFFDSDSGYFSGTGGHQVVEKSATFLDGLVTYCFDLWDDAIYEGSPNWRNAGQVNTVRLDPIEAQNATKIAIDWAGLYAENMAREGRFEIQYTTADPDNDDLSISFYRDTNRSGFNGTLIGSTTQDSPGSGTYTWNTAGVPNGTYYIYAVVNDGTNTNRFYTDVTVDIGATSGALPPENTCGGGTDCIFEELEPTACVGANGFLGQINIATVINRQATPLPVTVQYFNAFGALVDSVSMNLNPNLRQDFIINDMGLQPDSVGTVCVVADGPAGSWNGGLAIYKPDVRFGVPAFGERFDFALYYPFLNALTGRNSVPLNTFHLGTMATNTVANWVSITDAVRDGQGLGGVLRFYNSTGVVINETLVGIPDGGRADFSGHDGLSGAANYDAIGMAEFSPNGSSQKYYMTITRYFYDCNGAGGGCNNFHAAFNIPYRPGTSQQVLGGVATNNAEISVIELTNTTDDVVRADVKIYNGNGAQTGSLQPYIPSRGTYHVIVNGYLADNEFGSATVDALNGSLHAVSLFYKLDGFGTMEYAYAAPLTGSPGIVQVSSFNSFISQTNSAEIVNPTGSTANVSLDYRDFNGVSVYSTSFNISPRGTYRINSVPVPSTSYGTVIVNSNLNGLVSRNYTARGGSYVLPFVGQ
jgi:hypothetical protein